MQNDNFEKFWLHYLREHARPETRAIHIVGTGAALLLLGSAVVNLAREPHRRSASPAMLFASAAVAGYAPAWIGHYFLEGNRPATFKHPLWSLMADLRMTFLYVTGRLERQLTFAGVRSDESRENLARATLH